MLKCVKEKIYAHRNRVLVYGVPPLTKSQRSGGEFRNANAMLSIQYPYVVSCLLNHEE